ncbi:MAG: glycosyltransferase family 4 protein [Chthoniobacteraceae bacterium]|nr:glycosyltransferase family 4 protein [Chthoniobacteraceae bacterium]
MKILLSSHAFFPNIGGIESVSELLAAEFTRRGHEVVVVTRTPGPDETRRPFRVLRRPGGRALLGAVRWCDVFFHNNISLQTLWPLLWVRRPWVVAHQTWIARLDGRLDWHDRLKRFLLRFAAANVAISRAVAASLPVPCVLIPNPFRDDLFCRMPGVERSGGVVFLGRLVSDKGADLLLRALRLLKGEGLVPRLTVIGDGPEAGALRELARELGVAEQVDFAGPRGGLELARMLNAHRVLAVPSRWAEPFGVVALEGIACGCGVVGSREGGLADAIGPCGITFPNGDVPALAAALREALTRPDLAAQWEAAAPAHLAAHTARAVADAYLEVFEKSTR